MDMEVAIIDPGKAFNPTYMKNRYGDTRALSLEKVTGTMELGLHKVPYFSPTLMHVMSSTFHIW